MVLLAIPAHAPDPPHEGTRTRGRIARYARGRDYHRLFEPKLRGIVRAIREELGAEARATVDYGPLLERPLAARAGLGWLGKSTMLLAPGFGLWVLLGAIATTLAIEPDQPLRKSCGSCTRCIVACPTGAIAADGGVLDSRLCISYHTIESRAPIPRELRGDFGDWIFGCDDCLDSCPVGAANTDSHPDLVSASSDDAFPRSRSCWSLTTPLSASVSAAARSSAPRATAFCATSASPWGTSAESRTSRLSRAPSMTTPPWCAATPPGRWANSTGATTSATVSAPSCKRAQVARRTRGCGRS